MASIWSIVTPGNLFMNAGRITSIERNSQDRNKKIKNDSQSKHAQIERSEFAVDFFNPFFTAVCY